MSRIPESPAAARHDDSFERSGDQQNMIGSMEWLRVATPQARVPVTLAAMVLVLVFGAVDYGTGPEISFSIFYLIPIAAAAWIVGLAAGILTSVLAAATFLAVILLEQRVFAHPSIPYWNALVRLGLFVVVSLSLSSLHRSILWQDELRQFIVHDLRSPLANVMTGLQIIGGDENSKLDTQQRGFIEMCMVSCTRMLTLINSLLDLSRLERGGMPVHREKMRAVAICDSAASQVRLWARQTDIQLEVLVPEDAVVIADLDLTERVLVNLLSNAVRHAPSGSIVTTRVSEIDSTNVAFSVEDEGPGIPQEWAEKVFDTYVQADFGGSASRKGSGLGLAFSKRAIHAQGGRIWMKSSPDAGTVVTFTLPRAKSALNAHDAHEGTPTLPERAEDVS